jgi:hypothetical protein
VKNFFQVNEKRMKEQQMHQNRKFANAYRGHDPLSLNYRSYCLRYHVSFFIDLVVLLFFPVSAELDL